MIDVGVAQLKPVEQHYYPSRLAMFNAGGVSEIALRAGEMAADNHNRPAADVLSIADYLRADANLGHLANHPKDVANIHIFGLTGLVAERDKAHIEHYSVKETRAEQDGPENPDTDADVSTAGGYLKRGIMDPEAYAGAERKRAERAVRALILAEQLEAEFAALEARIEELTARLVEIDARIETLELKSRELAEAQALADGDLDEGTASGRANKERLSRILRKNGLGEVDDFRHPATGAVDRGTISSQIDAAKAQTERELEQAQQEREAVHAELEAAVKKRDEMVREHPELRERASSVALRSDISPADVPSAEEQAAYEERVEEDITLLSGGDPALMDADFEDFLFNDDPVVTAENYDAFADELSMGCPEQDKAIDGGIRADLAGGEAGTICAAFASAAAGDTVPDPESQELINFAYEQNSSQPARSLVT